MKKRITIELSLMEASVLREINELPVRISFPPMHKMILYYFWLGILVKHNTLALEVDSAETISDASAALPIVEIVYVPKNKSDLV